MQKCAALYANLYIAYFALIFKTHFADEINESPLRPQFGQAKRPSFLMIAYMKQQNLKILQVVLIVWKRMARKAETKMFYWMKFLNKFGCSKGILPR